MVCIDDSIVRGTTFKKAFSKFLAVQNHEKLVIASTAPQIRYPDCYGIDMSELGKFIAFQAAVSLIQEHGYSGLLKEVAEQCREALKSETSSKPENFVKRVYENFTVDQISERVAELVAPDALKEVTKVELFIKRWRICMRLCRPSW